MDQEHERRAKLGRAAGLAEAAMAATNNLMIDVIVGLEGAPFAEALAAETQGLRDRLERISGDLNNCAHSPDLQGFGDEHHRLAHRGEEPAAGGDSAQLAAIEGVRSN